MIQRKTHYGHTGYEVYFREEDKRRFFVFRIRMDLDDGSSIDGVKIQIIRLMKRKGEEVSQWHFSNRFKGSKYESVFWPYKLSPEISQVIMNCVEGEDLRIKEPGGKDTPKPMSSKDLADAGI